MGEGTASTPQLASRRIIERPRLIRLLDESPERIKLLVAPAGYGKTTLARQWLTERRAVWMDVTTPSHDVAAVGAGLRAAIGSVLPDSGEAMMERLSVTVRPSTEVDLLAEVLVQDLRGWSDDLWLVIDDYQAIAPDSAAEHFLEAVLVESAIRAMVLTRRMPAWASARRLLYGEIQAVDRAQLAMTQEEARKVIGSSREETADLMALAEGWPAVLGLAARLNSSAPAVRTSPELYRFFAEELYRRTDSQTARLLCELTLYDTRGRIGLIRSAERRGDELVRAAQDSGFVTRLNDGVEIHPLLTSFLEEKLRTDFAADRDAMVRNAVSDLIGRGLFDEAYDRIRRYEQPELLPTLLTEALQPMLEAGRSDTLREWLDHADKDVAATQLVAAELAYREGRFYEAEVLARLASQGATETTPGLPARANILAGRAALAGSRLDEAIQYYRSAREQASTDALVREALSGELVATNELEASDEAKALLELLGPVEDLPPAEHVVLVGRRLNYESHAGIRSSLEAGRSAWQLLSYVKDPVARSSFRNVLGYALVSACETSDTLRIAEEMIEDAERCRLDFVIPHALILRALAQYLEHDYGDAEQSANDAIERAIAAREWTARHIALAAQSRVFNAQGAFDATLGRRVEPDRSAARWLEAELESCYAVAYAAIGEHERSIDSIQRSEALSRSAEVRVNVAAARAICADQRNEEDSRLAHVRTALEAASSTGMLEPLVSAYRGYPQLIVALLADQTSHVHLMQTLSAAGDTELTNHATSSEVHSIQRLSPREKEVLGLLATGLSNREIGQRLFISPVTVKVHARHIYEKLGVRTRAEAALRAAQLGRH